MADSPKGCFKRSKHTKIVLNHVGGVLGLGQSYTSLRFDEDAELPSSEMVAARFRPYIETCIAAFGTSRCMFETNFPVDKISYSYHVFWNAGKLMAKGASSTEKADLFGGAAARCYRLNEIG